MFNLSFGEFVLVGILALVLIGPKELPEVARGIGKILQELKRIGQELSDAFAEIKKEANDVVEDAKKEGVEALGDTGKDALNGLIKIRDELKSEVKLESESKDQNLKFDEKKEKN